MSGLLARKLRAIGYPEAVDPAVLSSVQALVLWLEESKIRLHRQEDRGPFRPECFSDVDSWWTTFGNYLSQLECRRPIGDFTAASPPVPAQLCLLLDWLLGHAIALEYEDRGKKGRSALSETHLFLALSHFTLSTIPSQ